MAFGSSTFNDLAGAVSDLFSSQATATGLRLKASGDLAEAGNYDLSADMATQNAQFAEVSTRVKAAMTQRQIYQGIGTETADIAGSGFRTNTGSSLDLLRSSAAEGALNKQLVTEQGQITEAGYNEQAASYTNLAAFARSSAATEDSEAGKSTLGGEIGASLKGAAAVASLFTGGALDGFNVTQLAAPSLIGSGEYVGPNGYSPYAD